MPMREHVKTEQHFREWHMTYGSGAQIAGIHGSASPQDFINFDPCTKVSSKVVTVVN